MSRAFQYCAKQVLVEEGGLVDDHRDPGGRTNLGVTQATLDQARRSVAGLPARVDALTVEQALVIYERLYWTPIRGDDLALPLALVAFDAAVNQGVTAAAKFLQLAVGVTPDGVVGQQTLSAARSRPLLQVLGELGARRMHHYMLLDHLDDTFGLGWSRRLVRVLLAAHAAIGAMP